MTVGGTGPRKIRDGAFSICAHCATVSIFTVSPFGTIGLRPMTADELAKFQSNALAMKALRIVREAVRLRDL